MPKKRNLGKTNLKVTELGFGAWSIGGLGYGPVQEKQALETIKAYIESDGNFIDTARGYHKSEEILGKILSKNNLRKKLILASKTFAGERKETIPQIRKDLEESLKLLKTDYLDLYYLHQPPEDPEVIDAALNEFEKLKKQGKIRFIGASIKGPDVTDKTEELCQHYISTKRIDVIQLVYSILRQRLFGIIGEAGRNGVGIVARTVLESGLLTGKYLPGHQFDDHRARYNEKNLDYILKTAKDLENFAIISPFKNLAQVAIKFALEPKGVSSVILGAHTKEQIEINMAIENLPELNKELVEKLKNKYKDKNNKFNFSN